MPRFGKDKDARKEELDRQAADEVERLTRRGGPPGMGGGMVGPGGAPRIGIPSPLEQIADELRDAPPAGMRTMKTARRAPQQQQPQAFTPMPSGAVGSSFGPGGLNPGPRTGATAPPPSAFGGAGYDEDYGGPVTGPPVHYAEPDEEEEMTITELALMDHAARTGHNPEDLVMQYDASSAEDMRDRAMRQFYDRQQSRSAGPQTNNPFAPAGMRGGPGGPAATRPQDPAAAGGALAQRLANRRRREEEETRRSGVGPAPSDSSATAALARNKPKVASSPAARAAQPEPAEDEGALAKLLARRRQSLGVEAPEESPPAPGRRHAAERTATGMRPVPLEPELEDEDDEEELAPAPVRKAAARKATPAKKTAPATKKAPAAVKAPAAKAPVKKAKKAGAALADAPAPAARKAATKKAVAPKVVPATKKAAKPAAKSGAKSVFCIECGEKNPAVAKFCFNCGNRLAVPED